MLDSNSTLYHYHQNTVSGNIWNIWKNGVLRSSTGTLGDSKPRSIKAVLLGFPFIFSFSLLNWCPMNINRTEGILWLGCLQKIKWTLCSAPARSCLFFLVAFCVETVPSWTSAQCCNATRLCAEIPDSFFTPCIMRMGKRRKTGKSWGNSYFGNSQRWTRQRKLLVCVCLQGPKLIGSYSDHFCKFCRNVRIPYNFCCVVDWGGLEWFYPARTADVVWLTAINPALSPAWTADKVWLNAENPTLSCYSS